PVRELLRPDTWPEILSEVDRVVAGERGAGFTTLVAFAISRGYLSGASSGDSALYALSADRLGLHLTAHPVKNPPVGSGEAILIPFAAKLVKPWTVLAMTDGVWKYAGWDAVARITPRQNGRDVIEELQRRARLPGSGRFQDDFTVVVLQEMPCGDE